MKNRTPRKVVDTRAERPMESVYPFTAIVGQSEMKLALVLNAIDPSIGGVLIMGHRGTGKSTAVRGLADILPKLKIVRGCRFRCDPDKPARLCYECRALLNECGKLGQERGRVHFVNLPLGATEDRICGTIDIEKALTRGIKAFEPGLLAKANRGLLYIDEVNLLEHYLVDLLLDVSSSGRNIVEREGISVDHPSEFVLIGTGNPEEGELRPQLIDRFGLSVEIVTEVDLAFRVQIIQRREGFEKDSQTFSSSFQREQNLLRRKISRARSLCKEVNLSTDLLRAIAEICLRLNIDGHRGELTITRASRALASLEGRKDVSKEHVRRVVAMSLRHRMRREPFDDSSGSNAIDKALNESLGDSEESPSPDGSYGQFSSPFPLAKYPNDDGAGAKAKGFGASGPSRDGNLQSDDLRNDREIGAAQVDLRSIAEIDGRDGELAPGRRRMEPARGSAHRSISHISRGHYTRAVVTRPKQPRIAVDATLRSAAVRIRPSRLETESCHEAAEITIGPGALRYKKLSRKVGTLFIFVIDASGSMGRDRIRKAKGALVSLLRQSYVRRDKVALLTFRNRGAQVLMAPSTSATRARRLLDSIATGGATPLSAGLQCSLDVARKASRDGMPRISVLIFTDGGANVTLAANENVFGRTARTRIIEQELEHLGAGFSKLGCTPLIMATRDRFGSNKDVESVAAKLGGRLVDISAVALSPPTSPLPPFSTINVA